MSIRGVNSRWAIGLGALALLLLLAVSGCGDGGYAKNAGHSNGPAQDLNQSDAPKSVDQPARIDAHANGQTALNVRACSAAPCKPRDVSAIDLFSNRHGNSDVAYSVGPAATVEEVMEKGLRLAGASPVHLVVRGTAVADSAVRAGRYSASITTGERPSAVTMMSGCSPGCPEIVCVLSDCT